MLQEVVKLIAKIISYMVAVLFCRVFQLHAERLAIMSLCNGWQWQQAERIEEHVWVLDKLAHFYLLLPKLRYLWKVIRIIFTMACQLRNLCITHASVWVYLLQHLKSKANTRSWISLLLNQRYAVVNKGRNWQKWKLQKIRQETKIIF